MEIGLGGRAVADPGRNDARVALDRRGHRPAHRLDVLHAEIAGDREEAVLPRRVHHRHLPAEDRIAVVGEGLAHHVDERIAARDQECLLAVGGKAHVVGFERHGLPDADGFLTQALHVERDLLLPLRRQHPRVEDACLEHRAQAGAQQLGVGVRVPWADCIPVVVEDADQRVGDVDGLRGPRIDGRLPHDAGGTDPQVRKIGVLSRPRERLGHVQLQRWVRGCRHASSWG